MAMSCSIIIVENFIIIYVYCFQMSGLKRFVEDLSMDIFFQNSPRKNGPQTAIRPKNNTNMQLVVPANRLVESIDVLQVL